MKEYNLTCIDRQHDSSTPGAGLEVINFRMAVEPIKEIDLVSIDHACPKINFLQIRPTIRTSCANDGIAASLTSWKRTDPTS